MIEFFFNNSNDTKYNVSFFTCQYCFISRSFDNKNELKNHVLNYYHVDIRFFEIIRRFQKSNHNEHAKKHVYFFLFMNYAIIQISIFD